ncbi:retrovirus-related pol polyprotein from transposon TNT 1-94 [Tanacetum coccineum]
MSASNQQTLAESGANEIPSMLEKGNYISWESRFRRFLDNKLEEGERMWRSIGKGPYVRPMIPDPDNTTKQITEPLSKMTEINKKQYITDVRVMNYLLQAIPNDIDNLMDACKTAQEMWERIKRLMYGSDVTNHVRHSWLMDEGESLESVYERLKTLVNIMGRKNVRPIQVSINTKFLNYLQLEWSKYVIMIRYNQTGDTVSYDQLYYSLVQFEPHVQASKAKRPARNHEPLTLTVHSNASSSQSYANYQGELQGDSQEDKLTTAMMLLARDGRVDIQIKNAGYGGNGNRNAGRQNRNQAFNAGNGLTQNDKSNQIVQRVSRTESNSRKANVQCYNCNEKGHYARDYQKPRVYDAKYFKEQMLLAMKDEAGSNLVSSYEVLEGFWRGDVVRLEKEQQGGDVASLVAKEMNRGACKKLGDIVS